MSTILRCRGTVAGRTCGREFESTRTLTREEFEYPLCPRCEAVAQGLPVPDGEPVAGSGTIAERPDRALPTAEPDDWPTIPGYRVLGSLGRGGMGVVYKAEQVKANRRHVAVKMLRGRRGADAELDARFEIEIQAAAGLVHPNIVPIYAVDDHEGQRFFAMEYCPGGTLAERLKDRPFAIADAAATLEKLARAMHYVHERGIVHRDLKPLNVLYAADGEPKIADFGLAKEMEFGAGDTATGSIMGTLGFMSPEQASGRGNKATRETDVYALGAILYYCLGGRVPFAGSTAADTLHQIQHDDPVPLRKFAARVPRDLDTICEKCLQKEPARRYATALNLADDLRRYLEGRPILARPVSPAEKLWKAAKRHPARAALGATLLLAALGAAVGGVQIALDRRRADEADRRAALGKRNEAIADAAETIRAAARSAAPDWRAPVSAALAEAARTRPPGEDPTRLRSLIASTLTAFEMNRIGVDDLGRLTNEMAFTRDGRRSAIGFRRGNLVVMPILLRTDGEPDVELDVPRDGLFTDNNGVFALDFSPDGRWLAAGTRLGRLLVWDLANGNARVVNLPKSHTREINDLKFHHSGRHFVTGCGDGEFQVWSLKDKDEWKLHGKYAAIHGIRSLAFDPVGDHFAVCTGEGLEVYALDNVLRRTGPKPGVLRALPEGCSAACFTADGRTLGVVQDGRRLVLMDVYGDKVFQKIPLRADDAIVRADFNYMSIDAQSRHVALGGTDGTVKLFALADGRLLADLFFGGELSAQPLFRPNTHDLHVRDGYRVHRFAIPPNPIVDSPPTRHMSVRDLAFLPNSSRIALISKRVFDHDGKTRQQVSVWNAETRRIETEYDRLGTNHAYAGVPATIAVAPEGTVAFADIEVSGVRRWLPGGPAEGRFHACDLTAHFHFGRGGRHLLGVASGANYQKCKLLCYGWPDLDLRHKTESGGEGAAGRGLTNSAVNDFAATDRWALLGLADLTARLVPIDADGKPGADIDEKTLWNGIDRATFAQKGNSVVAVCLAADDSLAAWGDRQGHLFAKTLPGFRELKFLDPGHADGVQAIAYDPIARLLATGGLDRTLRLWRRDGDSFRVVLALPQPGPIHRLRFEGDGARLGVLIQDERTVHVWDLDRLRTRLAELELNW
jgi:eukaryotic-like serine/threonine-protein kinase